MRITAPAPAKINLWLRIGARQPSGFHDLDTLFCALDLADTVTVKTADRGAGIQVDARFAPPLRSLPDLGPNADNLATRAAAAFLERAGLPMDLEIGLVKRIPAGGGLGGGSSDAAAVLRGLTRLHPDAIPPTELHDIASSLGSDVPFFAAGQPLAVGRGRGVDLRPVPALPARPVLLVLPAFAIPTGDAYGWLAQSRDAATASAPAPPVLPPAEPAPTAWTWADVQARARNDFEDVVFHRHPRLGRLRDVLAEQGARPALLAGSGSTIFGVFDHDEAAHTAAEVVRRADPDADVLVTRTRSR